MITNLVQFEFEFSIPVQAVKEFFERYHILCFGYQLASSSTLLRFAENESSFSHLICICSTLFCIYIFPWSITTDNCLFYRHIIPWSTSTKISSRGGKLKLQKPTYRQMNMLYLGCVFSQYLSSLGSMLRLLEMLRICSERMH